MKISLSLISLMFCSPIFANESKFVEKDKETYVIHGLKDLELQLKKAKPSLKYLERKLDEVNKAIETYGESGYQLTDGKHAKRYAKIRKDSFELITYLNEKSGARKTLAESVDKELNKICHGLSKKLVQMSVCFKDDDYIEKYKFFHKGSQQEFDNLLKDTVTETVLDIMPKINKKYDNLTEAEMRMQFEKDMPTLVSEYTEKNQPKTDSMGIQMEMPYDLVMGLGTEFAQREEEFTFKCIQKLSTAPQVVEEVLINELRDDRQNFCPTNSTSTFSESPQNAIKKGIKSLQNLDAIRDLEEGGHILMIDNREEGQKFNEEIHAEKKRDIMRSFN